MDFKVPKGIDFHFGTFQGKPAVFMPIQVKSQMKLAPIPTIDVVFGNRVDGLTIGVRELPMIHDYVRDIVFPKFERFFSE